MAVLLIVTRQRFAGAMTRWAVHLARGLKTPLHIVSLSEGVEEYESTPVDLTAENDSIWSEVHASLADLKLTANRVVIDEASEKEIPVTVRTVAAMTQMEACQQLIAEEKAQASHDGSTVCRAQ